MSHFRSSPSIDRLSVWDGLSDIYRELYRGVEYAYVAAVAGDVAEFGTSSGKTAMTLAKAMAELIDGTPKRNRFAEAAHKDVCERFSDGRMAQRYREIYEEVLLIQ